MSKEDNLIKATIQVLKKDIRKKCCRCNKDYPIACYRKRHRKLKKTGTIKIYRESWCRKCENAYMNKRMKDKYNNIKNNDPQAHKENLLHRQILNRKSWNTQIDNLHDRYMASLMEWDIKDIKKYPELVEAKRAQLRLWRKAYPNQYHKNRKNRK